MTPSYVMESFFSKFITHKTSAIIYGIDIPSMHEPQWDEANLGHYNGVITIAMASQITSLAIFYSIVHSADQRKHQSSASLAFVSGIHR